MNCDDRCNLYLGETPGTSENPTLILEDVRNDYEMRRWYYSDAGEGHISEWFDMVEGESYYLESLQYVYSG
jgi:hypothetical protein